MFIFSWNNSIDSLKGQFHKKGDEIQYTKEKQASAIKSCFCRFQCSVWIFTLDMSSAHVIVITLNWFIINFPTKRVSSASWRLSWVLAISLESATVEEAKKCSAMSYIFCFHSLTNPLTFSSIKKMFKNFSRFALAFQKISYFKTNAFFAMFTLCFKASHIMQSFLFSWILLCIMNKTNYLSSDYTLGWADFEITTGI
jgi:hypothetical protein